MLTSEIAPVADYNIGIPNDNQWYAQYSIDKYRDRLIDIYILLNKNDFVQNFTKNYDITFKKLGIYIDNHIMEQLKDEDKARYKLFQITGKRFVDNRQAVLLENLNQQILEKVWGKILMTENIEDIEEYFFTSLCNELVRIHQ